MCSFCQRQKRNIVDFAMTKEQGISRMLTINLNDVEKELRIK